MPHTATAADRPADRRRDRRIDAPMTVVIGNTPYAIGDRTPAGARIVDYAGPLLPGDPAHLRVLVPTDGTGAMFRPVGRRTLGSPPARSPWPLPHRGRDAGETGV